MESIIKNKKRICVGDTLIQKEEASKNYGGHIANNVLSSDTYIYFNKYGINMDIKHFMRMPHLIKLFIQ
jgi:hypothetical protein